MPRAAKLVVGLCAIATFGVELNAQACDRFDVASIKVNTSGLGQSFPELAPGGRRVTAAGQYMVALLMFAFDVSPLQISGIPRDFPPAQYDIEATCEQPMTKEQLPALFQKLLAERFHLAAHRETKEEPVFALVLAKGGPKFHESSQKGGRPGFTQNGYRFAFSNAGMSMLAGVLSQLSGRKVLDRTGLTGEYDFALRYTPAPDPAAPVSDGLPDSVFTAVREQLGLVLEPQKSPIEFLVVDRLEPLTPN